jgi:hypothetical protein
MATPTRLRHFAMILITVPLLAGCTGQTAPISSPSPAPAGTQVEEKVAVEYPMPDLGPSPTPVPLSEDERRALTLGYEDQDWQTVVARYPDAVRPEVRFDGYTDGSSRIDALETCYEASGVPVERGTDEDGNLAAINDRSGSKEQAVAGFACRSALPSTPSPPPTDAMLGYIYDYLTQFLAPCYEANGMENPPPPSRADFIANFPNQNWWPAGPWDGSWAEGHSVDDACPMLP